MAPTWAQLRKRDEVFNFVTLCARKFDAPAVRWCRCCVRRINQDDIGRGWKEVLGNFVGCQMNIFIVLTVWIRWADISIISRLKTNCTMLLTAHQFKNRLTCFDCRLNLKFSILPQAHFSSKCKQTLDIFHFHRAISDWKFYGSVEIIAKNKCEKSARSVRGEVGGEEISKDGKFSTIFLSVCSPESSCKCCIIASGVLLTIHPEPPPWFSLKFGKISHLRILWFRHWKILKFPPKIS